MPWILVLLTVVVSSWTVACNDSPMETVDPLGPPEIDETGGVVEGPGVELTVPAGALSSPTAITIEAASPADIPASAGAPVDSIVPGALFDFGPDGLQFNAPVTVTIEYDPDRLPADTDESRLRIARIGSGYELVPVTARDTAANRISVTTRHFTWFGVLLPLPIPDFVASIEVREDIVVADAATVAGSDVVTIEVRETVAVADAPTTLEEASIDLDEAVTVADAAEVNILPVLQINVAETVGVTDAIGTVDVVAEATLYGVAASGSIEVIDPDALALVTSIPFRTEGSAIARRPGTNEIWVAERVTDSIFVVDAGTNQIVDRLHSGTLDPVAIAFDPAGARAVVADNDADRVTVLDAATQAVLGDVSNQTSASRMRDVSISSDGATAWIAGAGTVARVDLDTRQVLGESAAGTLTAVSDIELSPDDSQLWAYDGLAGNVVAFDALTLAVLDTIDIGGGTTFGRESLTFLPSGAGVWASGSPSGLAAIDVATRTVLTTLQIEPIPGRILIDADRSLAYVSAGGAPSEQNDIHVIDLSTGLTLERFPAQYPRDLLLFK